MGAPPMPTLRIVSPPGTGRAQASTAAELIHDTWLFNLESALADEWEVTTLAPDRAERVVVIRRGAWPASTDIDALRDSHPRLLPVLLDWTRLDGLDAVESSDIEWVTRAWVGDLDEVGHPAEQAAADGGPSSADGARSPYALVRGDRVRVLSVRNGRLDHVSTEWGDLEAAVDVENSSIAVAVDARVAVTVHDARLRVLWLTEAGEKAWGDARQLPEDIASDARVLTAAMMRDGRVRVMLAGSAQLWRLIVGSQGIETVVALLDHPAVIHAGVEVLGDSAFFDESGHTVTSRGDRIVERVTTILSMDAASSGGVRLAAAIGRAGERPVLRVARRGPRGSWTTVETTSELDALGIVPEQLVGVTVERRLDGLPPTRIVLAVRTPMGVQVRIVTVGQPTPAAVLAEGRGTL